MHGWPCTRAAACRHRRVARGNAGTRDRRVAFPPPDGAHPIMHAARLSPARGDSHPEAAQRLQAARQSCRASSWTQASARTSKAQQMCAGRGFRARQLVGALVGDAVLAARHDDAHQLGCASQPGLLVRLQLARVGPRATLAVQQSGHGAGNCMVQRSARCAPRHGKAVRVASQRHSLAAEWRASAEQPRRAGRSVSAGTRSAHATRVSTQAPAWQRIECRTPSLPAHCLPQWLWQTCAVRARQPAASPQPPAAAGPRLRAGRERAAAKAC